MKKCRVHLVAVSITIIILFALFTPPSLLASPNNYIFFLIYFSFPSLSNSSGGQGVFPYEKRYNDCIWCANMIVVK